MNNKYSNTITRLRLPTDERQISWLFTSITEKLNSGYQVQHRLAEWDLNPGPTDLKRDALTTLPCCLHNYHDALQIMLVPSKSDF